MDECGLLDCDGSGPLLVAEVSVPSSFYPCVHVKLLKSCKMDFVTCSSFLSTIPVFSFLPNSGRELIIHTL